MRPLWVISFAALLWSCAPAPSTENAQTATDLTADSRYTGMTNALTAIARDAAGHFAAGRFDDAAAAVQKGKPLQVDLLKVSRPTLAAMEATADLDEVYGRMLLRDNRVGWARDTFQKNVIRWKTWKPQTPDTERRWKAAVEAVAECDRRL